MKQGEHQLIAQNPQQNPYSFNVIPHLGFQLPSMQDHVQIQVIRVNALEKLNKIKQMFSLPHEDLKQFMESYQPYQQLKIDMKYLRETQKAKILKKNNSIYYGETKDNQMDGKGILFTNEGRIFEGSFIGNQKFKQGYEVYPTGNIYIGQFQRNQKHGHGVYFWFEQSMKVLEGCCATQYYKGDWWGGMPSGNGIHHRLTGDVYQGQFKNGLKHGKGFEKYPNGDAYKGHYVNGLPEGYGEYQWKDRSIYKGDFRQGLRQGFGIWKQKQIGQSQQYQGHYLADKKSGYGIYMWNKLQYYKGEFFEDKRHGFGELYQNNKLVYEGAWENGQKNPEIKYKKRPAYNQPLRLIERAKINTEGDQRVSNPKKQSSKNEYFRSQSHGTLKQPKFKITIKKNNMKPSNAYNSLEKMSINPEAIRIERQTNHMNRVGHKNCCVPIDQYLSINKGLTKR